MYTVIGLFGTHHLEPSRPDLSPSGCGPFVQLLAIALPGFL